MSGEGNGTQLQYSCLENPMDGGAWWAAVRGYARVPSSAVPRTSGCENWVASLLEKKAVMSRKRGGLVGFLYLRRQCGVSHEV